MTRVAFPEHDTTIPCQMAKSNAPRTFFRFFSAARRDGRAVGFGPCGVGEAKKSPRHRLTFAGTPTAGGELRRGYRRLTTPPCVLKHHAPWWVGAHITYIMPSGCQANPNGNPGVSTVRFGHAFRRPDRPPRNVPDGLFWPPCGLAEYFTSQQILGSIIVCSALKNGLLGVRSMQMKLDCTNLNKQSFVF